MRGTSAEEATWQKVCSVLVGTELRGAKTEVCDC